MSFDGMAKVMVIVAIALQLIFLGLVAFGLWIAAKYLGVF